MCTVQGVWCAVYMSMMWCVYFTFHLKKETPYNTLHNTTMHDATTKTRMAIAITDSDTPRKIRILRTSIVYRFFFSNWKTETVKQKLPTVLLARKKKRNNRIQTRTKAVNAVQFKLLNVWIEVEELKNSAKELLKK